MKKILFIVLITIFSFARQIDDIYKSLKSWAPLNIQIQSNNLIVTTKENRVTDTIYLAMINYALCTDYYFNKNF
jgi:predicted AAA+ superfamily ATPase